MAPRDATWTNWSGTYSVTPRRIARPRSVEEVAELVRGASPDELSVKAIGSGHSFTDIGVTRGILVHLDRLTGILAADRATGLVTVAAGTRLSALSDALWKQGLALTNLGDIDVQTIAGAISTGTHGTGRNFGGLASQLRGFQLVTPRGDILDCSADENSDIFDVGRISLGALGILTAVTLQCEPAYVVRAVEQPDTLSTLRERLERAVEGADHFEFYWFPHTDRVLTKSNTRIDPAANPDEAITATRRERAKRWIDDELLSNAVFEGVNRLTSVRPGLIRRANGIAARSLTAREYTDRSYRVFASPRRVRFREMEYALPVAALWYVLDEIAATLDRSGEQVGFPIEVRFSAPDDIPLSIAYDRPSCYVAVHQYHRRSHERYFADVEAIFNEVEGRPHWGKLHNLTAETLRTRYPRFDDFIAVRDKLDPERRFGNDYLRRVLGT